MVPLGYSGRLSDIQNERHYILKTGWRVSLTEKGLFPS